MTVFTWRALGDGDARHWLQATAEPRLSHTAPRPNRDGSPGEDDPAVPAATRRGPTPDSAGAPGVPPAYPRDGGYEVQPACSSGGRAVRADHLVLDAAVNPALGGCRHPERRLGARSPRPCPSLSVAFYRRSRCGVTRPWRS
jgi:hypothetical protein